LLGEDDPKVDCAPQCEVDEKLLLGPWMSCPIPILNGSDGKTRGSIIVPSIFVYPVGLSPTSVLLLLLLNLSLGDEDVMERGSSSREGIVLFVDKYDDFSVRIMISWMIFS
jgi:hypothetical protein